MIVTGDCREVLPTLDADSVDSVVTDPPYELGFMGKAWDNAGIAYDVAMWREVMRVMKPGAHLVAFGGTRTHHRMMVAIEDAGFEIRDVLMWLYGSGFPKSLDVSKAIDKAAGAERERYNRAAFGGTFSDDNGTTYGTALVETPATPEAAAWDGWGTALKPAYEPVVLARKPLSESTVAANVLRWGTGAINVDGCRIGTTDNLGGGSYGGVFSGSRNPDGSFKKAIGSGDRGRWPANLILSHSLFCKPVGTYRVKTDGHYPAARGVGGLGTSGHAGQDDLAERYTGYETVEAWECDESCPVAMLDAQSGRSKSPPVGSTCFSGTGQMPLRAHRSERPNGYGDSGGASRFFYVSKASRAERERGLGGMPTRLLSTHGATGPAADKPNGQTAIPARNHHPTVKPIALMGYLCRLVTPPGGIVLDPFTGSGSTGVAALAEGFGFLGIERDPEYVDIAERRIGIQEMAAD